jgi:hypothetical protein
VDTILEIPSLVPIVINDLAGNESAECASLLNGSQDFNNLHNLTDIAMNQAKQWFNLNIFLLSEFKTKFLTFKVNNHKNDDDIFPRKKSTKHKNRQMLEVNKIKVQRKILLKN